MATAVGRKRQVLANFINDVPPNKGWWFRLPKFNTSGKKSAIHPTDACLPHLGVPFGVSEDCMAVVLMEMECLKLKLSIALFGSVCNTISIANNLAVSKREKRVKER
jgi:hypothetical protein